MMKPKTSMFAEEERGNRRSKLGDPLVGLAKHVDFMAIANEIDVVLPRPSRAKGGLLRVIKPTRTQIEISKFIVLPHCYAKKRYSRWP